MKTGLDGVPKDVRLVIEKMRPKLNGKDLLHAFDAVDGATVRCQSRPDVAPCLRDRAQNVVRFLGAPECVSIRGCSQGRRCELSRHFWVSRSQRSPRRDEVCLSQRQCEPLLLEKRARASRLAERFLPAAFSRVERRPVQGHVSY